MIPVPPDVRVLIATRPVDFRKGADSLAALAKETLGQDPFSGAVLVFRSRRADRVKILVWDGSGLVLVWDAVREVDAGPSGAACARQGTGTGCKRGLT